MKISSQPFKLFQALSITDGDIVAYRNIVREIENINLNYDAFVESAKREMSISERNFNAMLLSGSGFFFQMLKDFEYELANEIRDRSIVVSDQECIAEANRQLQEASERAGSGSQATYRDIMDSVTYIRYFSVYPLLIELARAIPHLAAEPMNLFGHFNPVTNMENLFATLLNELDYFEVLFEDFIDETIHEMNTFENFHRDSNIRLIQSFGETSGEFFNSTISIRNFLITECN